LKDGLRPTDLKVDDLPSDAGKGLRTKWEKASLDEADQDPRLISGYQIHRATVFKGRKREGKWKFEPALKEVSPHLRYAEREKIRAEAEAASGGTNEVTFRGPFLLIKKVPYGTDQYEDKQCEPGVGYFYRVTSLDMEGQEAGSIETPAPVAPVIQWFDHRLGWFLFILALICGSVVYFIEAVKSGRQLKVRKIAGLAAVEEAVGRATEMGRSCLYIPGIGDMNEIQTIASMTILSRLAKVAAEHDAQIEVPNCRSLVMTTARETVQAAFLAAGHPEAYNQDLIYYLTDEQFGYVAAVSGHMVREKPAACFYLGQFYAESLILAETGNSIGAIQIAGTAMPAQLPFFVAACDYTLIGEEFYAASAYLSGEPHQLGSLKGQDVGKSIVGVLVLIGCLLSTMGAILHTEANPTNVFDVSVTYIQEHVLTAGG